MCKKLKVIIFLLIIAIATGSLAQYSSASDSLKLQLKDAANDENKCKILYRLSLSYAAANYDSSIKYAEELRLLSKNINNKQWEASGLKVLAGMKFYQGKYNEAMQYYLESAKIWEQLGKDNELGGVYNNMGNIYYFLKNFDKSIEYYKQSAEICFREHDSLTYAEVLYNIANIYQDNKESFSEAKEYMEKSLGIFEKIKNYKGIAYTLNGLGNIYDITKDYSQSIIYYSRSLTVFHLMGDKKGESSTLAAIGTIYEKTGNTDKCIRYLNQGLELANEIGDKDVIMQINQNLGEIYYATGEYKKSIDCYKLYNAVKDSILNEENIRQVSEMEAKYKSDLKQKEIEKQNLLLEKSDLEIKQQTTLKYAFVSGFILMIVISLIIFRNYRTKKKANILLSNQNIEIKQQKEEIQSQRDEIEFQKDLVTGQKKEIEEIHKEIKDSIIYAQKIQKAVLPSDSLAKRLLKEHFILYKPKDVVSGDFYWYSQVNQWTLVAIADCTGHGVPGGFMSMLGVSFLNEIVARNEFQNAGNILDKMRQYVITSLQQNSNNSENSHEETPDDLLSIKDGMDISFIAIDNNTGQLQYAGANSPIFIYRDASQVLEEIKPDKMPVAIHLKMDHFTNHTIRIEKGDLIYMFSDGFADQFGGPSASGGGKKFKYRNFANLIKEIAHLPIEHQKEKLENTIENWKTGFDIKYEQTDDITVMGIKI